MMQGKLISLEGLDGVGKTTCAKLLSQMLTTDENVFKYVNRKTVPVINEYIQLHMQHLYDILWGKGKVFSQAPDIAYNGLNPDHWRHLMIAWYSAFEQLVILPMLKQGKCVITDGYIYKEIAKAIYSRPDLKTEQEFDFLYKPDMTFYLVASPEECVRSSSLNNRVESGKFVGLSGDFISHQTKMKFIYDELAKQHHWIPILRSNKPINTCYPIIEIIRNNLH